MSAPPLPDHDSIAYLWWSTGALDEQRARDEGLSEDARQLRDLLAALARQHPEWTMGDLAACLARIACPEKLKRRHRL